MRQDVLFSILDGVGDDLLLDAMPSSLSATIGQAPVYRPHPFRALGRFLNSGIGVAVISGVVALGVLVAVVAAGRIHGPEVPPGGTVTSTEGESEAPDSSTETLHATLPEAPTESETETDTVPPQPLDPADTLVPEIPGKVTVRNAAGSELTLNRYLCEASHTYVGDSLPFFDVKDYGFEAAFKSFNPDILIRWDEGMSVTFENPHTELIGIRKTESPDVWESFEQFADRADGLYCVYLRLQTVVEIPSASGDRTIRSTVLEDCPFLLLLETDSPVPAPSYDAPPLAVTLGDVTHTVSACFALGRDDYGGMSPFPPSLVPHVPALKESPLTMTAGEDFALDADGYIGVSVFQWGYGACFSLISSDDSPQNQNNPISKLGRGSYLVALVFRRKGESPSDPPEAFSYVFALEVQAPDA